MGADIYLESVWKPFERTLKFSPPSTPLDSVAEVEAYFTIMTDQMRASGGYFRNGYNAGDVMWAMGLSWRDTVQPMLDRGYLPIKCARELLTTIEARPITRERLARHIFEHMTDGGESHPLLRAAKEFLAADDEPPQPFEPPDFDTLMVVLTERREELLAILRKSIELNEPLLCSL